MSTPNLILAEIKRFPKGIWIREIARRVGCSPATVCNHIYGYTDRTGKYRVGILKNDVVVSKMGDGALTMVRPK